MSTRKVKLQFSDFDFNKVDMAFVKRHFDGHQSKTEAEISNKIAVWLRDRSPNPACSIHYEIESDIEDGSMINLMERGTLSTDGHEVLSITISHIHRENLPATFEAFARLKLHVEEYAWEGEGSRRDVLEDIDNMFAAYNERTARKDNPILYSLRPILRSLLPAFSNVYDITYTEKPQAFFTQLYIHDTDGPYVQAIMLELHNPEVAVPHLKLVQNYQQLEAIPMPKVEQPAAAEAVAS